MEQSTRLKNVKTHLAFSVISAVCLCLPLGVAAIVLSARTGALLHQGETERARKVSKTAFALCVASAVLALIGILYAVVVRLTD